MTPALSSPVRLPEAAGGLPGPAPLGLRAVPWATVLPWREGEERGTLEMGVIDACGHAVRSTLIRRSYGQSNEGQVGYPGSVEPAPETTRPGTAIYAGPWLDHFGHFLLEGLARAWAIRRHPELPVVWSADGDWQAPVAVPGDDGAGAGAEAGAGGGVGPGVGNDPRDTPGGWRAALLETLGIRNEMILVREPMRFERLLVPDAGYQIQHVCHPEHAAALGVVERRPEPGRKLWLSRSRLPQMGNLSIPLVEARLEELGWTVIAPETLSIPEQMAELARAERVAGEMGSQLHPLLLLKDPAGLRVDVFLRDPSRAGGVYNRNYDTIAAAKRLDQRLHHVASEVVLRARGVQVEKLATDLAEYFRALDIPEGPGEAAEAANAGILARYRLAAAPGSPIDPSLPALPEGAPMPNDLATPDTSPDTDGPGELALGPDGRPTLDALAEKFNTDKATRHRSRDGKAYEGHGYAPFYERFFRDFRDAPIAIMELGCGQVWNIGASLRMLKAYFPEAEVIGVDNKPAARRLIAEGFRIEVGDLGRIEFLRRLRRYRPTILIDDASHLWSHQILAMAELYDTLPPGGIYVMEDINTSFGHLRETYAGGTSFSGHDFVTAVSTALHAVDRDHLRTVPYPEYVDYVARRTSFVAQFRHTALFVRS